jgi:hypothetical protein
VGVVGAGRSGSVAALALRQVGVRRFTLVDPDDLELHNLGEMAGVRRADVVRKKALALADGLARDAGAVECSAVAESVTTWRALAALKPADLLLCCVDNPAARLATACLAVLYLKPLLDLGTGVFRERGGRRLGADVRLVLPGRCLLCLGGIAGVEETGGRLLQEAAPAAPRDWRQERAGSLHSLNGVAVHLGVRLVEDLAEGRLAGSTWLHLDYDEAGRPNLEAQGALPRAGCRLCALTALGDGGCHLVGGFLTGR